VRALQIVEHAAGTLGGRRGVTNYRRSYVATASALPATLYAYARRRLQQSTHTRRSIAAEHAADTHSDRRGVTKLYARLHIAGPTLLRFTTTTITRTTKKPLRMTDDRLVLELELFWHRGAIGGGVIPPLFYAL